MSSSAEAVFSLKGKSLKCDSAEAIQAHLEPLVADQDVQVVVLGGNTFGIGACHEIGMVLKTKEKLKEADLADIFTGRLISEIPQSLGSLCNSLLNLQNLTVVDLSDNAFGGRCVDVMVPFLSSHLPLEELRLANNGLGPAGATVIADALYQLGIKAQQAGQTSRLKKIICGRNRCENGSTKSWGKAFQVHPDLMEVRLFQNDIRNYGWDPIMSGLSHCSKLQVLDMWDNTATEKGSKAVANALPHLGALRELNLGDCLLKPRGGAMIARALKLGNNPQLEHLKLSGSEIDEEVVGLLVDYVKAFGAKLKKVELNDNYGDPDAAVELSGTWGAMKDALDAWDNGAELDELDEIVERDSDDEGENSQASDDKDDDDDDDDNDGDSEVEEKFVADAKATSHPEAAQDEPEMIIVDKPTESDSAPELPSSQAQPTPATIPPPTIDDEVHDAQVETQEGEKKPEETETSVPAASSSPTKKEKPSKEDGLYDLLTQTIEALKIT
ncbi:hypothetical protein PCASD_07665 [Puccinia coronata f. sp. avenae]|uniref:Ran GTPase-activating protein 1 n=1 Tax=Puccinia coronata f. sp. avenae TaxID=200324 RepID=A0A2N5UP40_9BASI|nr:hypothetical protein PCASD_07665 [Puccinia coronata f. sp. avenae]